MSTTDPGSRIPPHLSAISDQPPKAPGGLFEQISLRLSGSQNQPLPGTPVVTDRYPLVYTPSANVEVNAERLPPAGQLAEMELAYRQEFYTGEVLATVASTQINTIFLVSLATAIGLLLVGTVIPLDIALYASAAVSFFLVLRYVLRSNASPLMIVALLLGPPAVVLVVCFFAHLLAYRRMATPILGALTFVIFFCWGKAPFAFYHEWLYTHPRLRPETRRRPKTIAMRPQLLLLAAILTLAWVGPRWSLSATTFIILAIAVGFAVWDRGLFVLNSLKTVLGRYLTYGLGSAPAPGVWIPRHALWQRQATLVALMVSLFLTLAVGLYIFCPYDLLQAHLDADFEPAYLADTLPTPTGWIEAAMIGIAHGRVLYLWMFPVALVLAVLTPLSVLVALYRGPVLAAEELRTEIDETLDNDGRPPWQWYVDRIRGSTHEAQAPLDEPPVREADHLFLGVEPYGQLPVLLDRSILREHCYIVGETGSGKTSLGIMPLLIQLIRGCNFRDPDKKVDLGLPERRPPDESRDVDKVPLVILDLKGDPVLFQTIRAEARERGQDFRFFTPEQNRPSHYFNPFLSLQGAVHTPMQICQIFLESLSLAHGEGYGRSYYSRRSRDLLFEALRHNPQSFEKLNEIIASLPRSADRRDTFELVSTIRALTQYPMLASMGPVRRPDEAIHMPSVLKHRQIVYFWLPAAIESISVREIGKLAVFCLLTAAIDRQRNREEPRQAYLVIDEFQRLAGENFKIVLEQARSYGIGVILANQTQSDLVIHRVDLRPAVRTNTRSKMYFSVTDPKEVRDLSDASGQEVAVMKSWSEIGSTQGARGTRGWAEAIKPRLTTNDIIRVSDHPLEFILQVSRGAGYTQFAGVPLSVRTLWPITKDTRDEYAEEDWPAEPSYDEDIVVTSDKSPCQIDQETREFAADVDRKLSAIPDPSAP